MSTDNQLILRESDKYSLCSNVIMSYNKQSIAAVHIATVHADNVQRTFLIAKIFILGQIYFYSTTFL